MRHEPWQWRPQVAGMGWTLGGEERQRTTVCGARTTGHLAHTMTQAMTYAIMTHSMVHTMTHTTPS